MAQIGFRLSVLIGGLSLLIMGCGGEPKPEPVRGKVQYEGQPLANVSVTFLAQDSDGRDAHGSTDANGVFHLSTFESNDGALPGKYKVIIQSLQEFDTSIAAATPDEARTAMTEGRIKPKIPSIVIPPRYSQPGQTILVQEIPAQGDVILDLKKNP